MTDSKTTCRDLAKKFANLFNYICHNVVEQTIPVKTFLMFTGKMIAAHDHEGDEGAEWVTVEVGELLWKNREVFDTEDISIIANHFIEHDWKQQRYTWKTKFKIPEILHETMVEMIRNTIRKIRDTSGEKNAKIFRMLYLTYRQYIALSVKNEDA